MTIFVMLFFVMFGKLIRDKRLALGISIKELAARLVMDPSLLSRIEHETRLPNKKYLPEIASELLLDIDELTTHWIAHKVNGIVQEYPQYAPEVLMLMESRVEYLTSPQVLEGQEVSKKVSKLLNEVDELKNQWQKLAPSKGIQLDKLNESFDSEYTYESNRIEGNTLSLQETYLVISQGLTIAGKSIQEHLEAINHDEAIEFVRDLVGNKTELNQYRLKQIHHLILKGIDRKNAGVFRSVPVRIGGSKHLPPEPYLLNKLMEDYFIHYQNQKNKMHPVLLAAEMHERLVSIHPFIDGNGRTSRLVMNLILLQHGYTIANLKGSNENRQRYYSALESVQVNNNPEPFYLLIAETLKESLQEHLKMV